MVFMSFSQDWAKELYGEKIRHLWQKVITASTPDLWVKIFYYRDKVMYYPLLDDSEKNKAKEFFKSLDGVEKQHTYPHNGCNGHYRCGEFGGHGFYDTEWKFIRKHHKISHCITLKLYEGITDDNIVQLMAHEYRHYRQWKKYGARKMNPKWSSNGRRPIQVERDANKWAEQRTKKLGYQCW